VLPSPVNTNPLRTPSTSSAAAPSASRTGTGAPWYVRRFTRSRRFSMKCRRKTSASPGVTVSSDSLAACPVCFRTGGAHDFGCTLAPAPLIKHLPGCGREARGCLPGCENYDPAFDGPGPKETVDHPTHYTDSPAHCLQCKRPIECIDVAEHWGFLLGNALKYLWRAGKKGPPVEDLRKAIWYIQRQIDRLLEAPRP
jgi:hypothetical protein